LLAPRLRPPDVRAEGAARLGARVQGRSRAPRARGRLTPRAATDETARITSAPPLHPPRRLVFRSRGSAARAALHGARAARRLLRARSGPASRVRRAGAVCRARLVAAARDGQLAAKVLEQSIADALHLAQVVDRAKRRRF